MLGPILAGLSLAILVGVGAGALLGSAGGRAAPASPGPPPSTLHGQATWAPGALAAPAILGLRDQAGRPFSLGGLRGHTVAIAFFDSHCNQACPLEGRALAAALAPLAREGRPTLVLVSVNPRDTPASTRAAVRKWGLSGVGTWHWLRGSRAALARVWRAYHIFVAAPVHGDIVHTEALYLLDRRGYERSGYLYPFAPRFVSSDLRQLARSDSQRNQGA